MKAMEALRGRRVDAERARPGARNAEKSRYSAVSSRRRIGSSRSDSPFGSFQTKSHRGDRKVIEERQRHLSHWLRHRRVAGASKSGLPFRVRARARHSDHRRRRAGNEIGTACIADAVRKVVPTGAKCGCPCDSGIAAATATDYCVFGSKSNYRGFAIEACLAAGLERSEIFHSELSPGASHDTGATMGLVDPFTGLAFGWDDFLGGQERQRTRH